MPFRKRKSCIFCDEFCHVSCNLYDICSFDFYRSPVIQIERNWPLECFLNAESQLLPILIFARLAVWLWMLHSSWKFVAEGPLDWCEFESYTIAQRLVHLPGKQKVPGSKSGDAAWHFFPTWLAKCTCSCREYQARHVVSNPTKKTTTTTHEASKLSAIKHGECVCVCGRGGGEGLRSSLGESAGNRVAFDVPHHWFQACR